MEVRRNNQILLFFCGLIMKSWRGRGSKNSSFLWTLLTDLLISWSISRAYQDTNSYIYSALKFIAWLNFQESNLLMIQVFFSIIEFNSTSMRNFSSYISMVPLSKFISTVSKLLKNFCNFSKSKHKQGCQFEKMSVNWFGIF